MPLGNSRIYLYAKNVDMRKSFDGLHGIIQSEFQRDVRLGDLFLVPQSTTQSYQAHVLGS
jgi:hypothetical protein